MMNRRLLSSFDAVETFHRVMSEFVQNYGHLPKEEQLNKLFGTIEATQGYYKGTLRSMVSSGGVSTGYVNLYFQLKKLNKMFDREIEKRELEIKMSAGRDKKSPSPERSIG